MRVSLNVCVIYCLYINSNPVLASASTLPAWRLARAVEVGSRGGGGSITDMATKVSFLP